MGGGILPANNSQLFDSPIFNAMVPKEGPKALGVTADFSLHASYTINLLLTQSQQYMSLVQAVFVDNSANADEVTINATGLNQSLIVPPNCQAYLPFLVTKNATVTASSAGGVKVGLIFLNIPVPAIVWNVTDGGGGGGSGNPAAGPTGSAPPADASYTGVIDSVSGDLAGLTGFALGGNELAMTDLEAVGGVAVLRGTGVTGTGSQRVTVARDATTIAGAGVGTAGSPSVNVVSIQGIASGLAVPVDGELSVLVLTQNTNGFKPKRLSALSTTVQGIAASNPAQLMVIQAYNPNSTVAYLQIFDVATTGGVTLGTTVPTLSIAIAPTSTGGFSMSDLGVQFANGIQIAATTTATGSTALATAVDANAVYMD